MPVLSNPKHERFAQELAKGKTADEAYQLAGYAENRGNATRLKANESVVRRLSELQTRAAEKAITTAQDIADQLDEDRAFARELKQASAAVAASMGKAKVLGLITDKVAMDATVRDERELDDAALTHIARSGSDGIAAPPARPN